MRGEGNLIGLRVGLAVGQATGEAVGVSADPIVPPSGGGGGGTSLVVTIADSADPVINVVNFTYAVDVTNTGGVDATLLSAVVTLDPSLTFVSATGTGWATGAVGQIVTCTRALLAPGAAPTITVTVTTADAASTETTTADAIASNAPAAPQDSETTVVKLVARDATSAKRVPASLTQWQDFNAYHMAVATPSYPNVTPTAVYLCQEASGNLADSIGAVTLTASGAGHLYQQAVIGWSRLAVQFVDGTVGQKWINTTTAPNPSLTSINWMSYISWPLTNPASARCLMASQSGLDLRLSTGGKVTFINGASTAGTVTVTAGVPRIVEMKHDLTNSVFTGYTDAEKVTGTYAANASNTTYAIGGQTVAASGSACMYLAIFTGAAAELSDAQIKARQTALGWSPLWT